MDEPRTTKPLFRLSALALLGAASAVGCFSGPAAVRPDLDPGEMTRGAIKAYDTDADGALSAEELKRVPGVAKYAAKYDSDGDNSVSQDELRARFDAWEDQGLSFRRLDATVTLRGRPLAGASVEFVPEVYMSPSIKPARGTTDGSGQVKISVAPEDLPPALKSRGDSFRGVYVGTYRIKVSHPRAKLAPAYAAGDALGEEVARDTVPPSIAIALESTK
ncbi:MAG: hypothetical protein ACRCT8_12965 [Lacipirellulaceae bacterium]